MAQEFYVQILSDDEWQELDYEGIENSIGFADPKKGMAFVRKTGIPEMDYGTLVHEVNHLVEKHGKEHPDWEDGILHKSGGSLGKILGPVVGTITGLLTANPMIGAAVGGAISGGTQAHTQSSKPEKYGAPSIGSIGGSALMGGLGSFGGAKLLGGGIAGATAAAPGFGSKVSGALSGALKGTAATANTKASSGLLGAGGNLFGSATPFSSSAVTPNVASKFGNAVSNSVGSGLMPATGFAGTATPLAGAGATGGAAASTAGKTFSFKDLINPQTVLGGTALLGSMAPKQPQFEMPPSIGDLRSKLNSGGFATALGGQAQGELKSILGSTPSQLNAPADDAFYANTFRQIDMQYDTAKKQLDQAYNNAGMLGSGEYFAELNKLTQSQADAKNDYVAQENQRRFEFGSNQKMEAVRQSLGVDQNTFDNLVGLTGLSVQEAAIRYGAQAADITSLRQSLGTLGGNLLTAGLTK